MLARILPLALFLFVGLPVSAQVPSMDGPRTVVRSLDFGHERYIGEFRNGKRNGHGVLLSSGNRYEGEFKDGWRDGRGVLLRADGARYEGEWKDDLMTGQGVFLRPDGRRYEGGFAKGEFHGHGVYSYPNGDRCEGEWGPSRFGGSTLESGICRMANGDRYEGRLDDYGGMDFIASGLGVLTRRDGSVYGGTWVGGCRGYHDPLCAVEAYSMGGPVRGTTR